jgi:hypothetical protein
VLVYIHAFSYDIMLSTCMDFECREALSSGCSCMQWFDELCNGLLYAPIMSDTVDVIQAALAHCCSVTFMLLLLLLLLCLLVVCMQ